MPIIIAPMTDAPVDTDQLAQRYLALWTEYLTALLANPQAMETLKRWTAFAGQFAYPGAGKGQGESPPFPAWPPFFGPFGALSPAPREADHSDEIATLTQRLDELERRLAALERRPKPSRSPRGIRTTG